MEKLKKYFREKDRLKNTYLIFCEVCGCTDEVLVVTHSCEIYLRKKVQDLEKQITSYMNCKTLEDLQTKLGPRNLERLCELIEECDKYKERLKDIQLDNLSDYESISN